MMALNWVGAVLTDLAASLILLAAGFLIGRWRERRRLVGRALSEYDFYPYAATPENFAEFSLKDFRSRRTISCATPTAARRGS